MSRWLPRTATAVGLASAIALWTACGPFAPAAVAALETGWTMPAATLQQRPGARLPGDITVTDSEGRRATLRTQLGPGPALLVPGYYRCPQLCGLLMQGLIEAGSATGLPADAYRIVALSFDPADTPRSARDRLAVYRAFARHQQADGPRQSPAVPLPRLLVASRADVGRVMDALGLDVQRQPDAQGRIAHPAFAVVVSPQARIARYLMGVRFDPAELRTALDEAARGGPARWTDRIAALCAHIDPRLGRHSETVLGAARVLGIGLVTGLIACWALPMARRRRPGRGGRR